ncbi:hypothetical protein CLIB1423_09S01156 [[Candida] railenensis]|uniref:Anaphase-promoting complex subunit 5 n=1 Tax=[Candida] railenensis TaxID=45579 RepID=A0A9P0QRF2_9ASCO|nr:hypothetical protein CLIB1423_09S01156 [[Candida] railenensis]
MAIRLLLSEDISPHKISLLFLIGIYCTGNLPHNEIRIVLRTIMKLLEYEPLYKINGEMVVVPGILDLVNSIGPKSSMLLLTALWRINSVESLETSISAMQSLLSSPNMVVKQQILIENDDENENGAENVVKREIQTVQSRILPSSFLGLFLQKIVTTCSLLHFDESLLLYESFLSYREDSYDMFLKLGGDVEGEKRKLAKDAIVPSGKQKKSNNETQSDFDLYSSLSKQLHIEGLPIQLSLHDGQEDKEKSKAQNFHSSLVPIPKHDLQILLDKQVQLLESNGTPTPPLLREIMNLMTSPNSNTSLIQNADFSNLPSYHYIAYLEALKNSDYNGAFSALHQYFDYMVSNNSKYFYHFALISRASLHQHFGEDEKALNAIEEAISVARENKDNSTLTYILSWLYNFMKNKPQLWHKQSFNNEQHLLEFLVTKCQSVSLPLYSMSYQFETLHVLNSGEGSISKYIESLLKATYISIHDYEPASFMKSIELSSSVWFRIGNTNLAKIYSEVAKDVNPKLNIYDNVSIQIRQAYLLFHQGEVENAYQKLEKLKKLVGNDRILSHNLQIRSLILLVKINLKRERPYVAEGIVQILMNTEVQELELKLELVYLFSEVQLELGNLTRALTYLTDNMSLINENEVPMMIKLNLLKCRIFIDSGVQSRGLSLLLQQIQRAKKIGMMTLVVEGECLLISLLNRMESYQDSYSILYSIMPNVLMVQGQDFISTAYFEFAYVCMKLLEQDTTNKQLLGQFFRFLNISIDGHKKLLNLKQLKKCFELEYEMAKLRGIEELEQHAVKSLEKLKIRSEEEVNYGFIQE